jgi:hypothetical protein
MATGEREANPGVCIEDHNRDAIFICQHVKRLLRSGCDPFNVRLHAAADIEQQQNVHGHVLTREITDRYGFAAHAQDKVALLKTGDRATVAVEDLHVDARQSDIAFESNGVVVRKGADCNYSQC